MKREVFSPARRYAGLTVGDTVRVTRELQELTQSELAHRAGLSQPILSAIEKGRLSLGVERAKRLAGFASGVGANVRGTRRGKPKSSWTGSSRLSGMPG